MGGGQLAECDDVILIPVGEVYGRPNKLEWTRCSEKEGCKVRGDRTMMVFGFLES